MDGPKPEQIRRQVEAICLSPPLDRARRRRALLHYIVEASLAGQRATEKAIAVNVYEKDADSFDPAIDTVVRVETGKLRNGLKKFYETNGKRAPIRITIKGYVAIAQYNEEYDKSQPSTEISRLPPPSSAVLVDIDEQGQIELPQEITEWLCTIGTTLLRPKIVEGSVIRLQPEFERHRIPAVKYIPIDLRVVEHKPQNSRGVRMFIGNIYWTRICWPICIEIPFNLLMTITRVPPSQVYVWREDDQIAITTKEV